MLPGQADFVILALGESADMTGESASRTDISLPGVQMKLAEACDHERKADRHCTF